VTHSVANCVKRVVVIVSSVLFFRTPIPPINALDNIDQPWRGRGCVSWDVERHLGRLRVPATSSTAEGAQQRRVEVW
jgi:hypothetical protein